MFAVGQMALGYLIGRAFGKATGRGPNIPIVLTFSVLPDIDLLIPFLQHRGPTHSIIVELLAFAPLFILLGVRKAAPYLAALASHPMIGDYLTGGIQLFWPVSHEWVSCEKTMMMGDAFETRVELALFAVLIITLLLTGDIKRLFKSEKTNLLFSIPISTIILPVTSRYPVRVPSALIMAHLLLMIPMAISFIIALTHAMVEMEGHNSDRG